jgi:hypothetical protein
MKILGLEELRSIVGKYELPVGLFIEISTWDHRRQ